MKCGRQITRQKVLLVFRGVMGVQRSLDYHVRWFVLDSFELQYIYFAYGVRQIPLLFCELDMCIYI